MKKTSMLTVRAINKEYKKYLLALKLVSLLIFVNLVPAFAFPVVPNSNPGINNATEVTQKQKISGIITDAETKQPLIGVTILSVSSKGVKFGTVTDLNGKFSLDVTDVNSTFSITYIGYEKQVIKLGNNTFLKIELKSQSTNLDEVVVVGYGVMRKSDLTGSVGKVNVSDIKKVSTIDAAQAIQGRLAGVNVITNSGNPGAGVTIRVRGIGTINNSDPLYVVDGFPVSDISHIAPTDIESMEVLKDASATAIYGSRGANGVILVKTRTGSKGSKFEVQANVFSGVSRVGKTFDMADATQFAAARKELGQTDDMTTFVLDNQAKGNYLKGTNWQKEIFRDAINKRYNVSIMGSGDSYNYDHGVTYSSQEGIVKGSYLDKIMFHSNNNFNITKKIKMGFNMNYVWYNKPGDSNGDFYSGVIPGALRSDPISAAWDPYTNFYGEIYYSPSCTNPALAIWKSGYQQTTEDRFIGNFFFQMDDIFVNGLSFRSQFGKQLTFSNQKNFSPRYIITPTQKNDDQTLYQNRYNGNSWTNTNYFSYNKLINKLNVNSTLGMEIQANSGSDIWAKGFDVPENADLQYLGAHKDIVKFDLGGGASQNRLASGFFRSNFTWDNKYLLTGTVRLDGSSKFMSQKRWGWFPSFSAGWNIANESFMENIKNTVSNLKVRAGWGIVGNQASAGDFNYVSSVAGGYVYVLNGVPVDGAIQRQLANKELGWELAEQYNIGADFGFFNQSLTGSVDYFIRNTKDMILSSPIPMFAGKQRPNVNAGTMSNKGIEFTVNYAKSINDFKFDMGLNLTFIKNKITSLAGGDPIRSGGVGKGGNSTKTEVGREIAYFYGYKTDGIFKTADQLAAHNKEGIPIQPEAALGDVIYKDLNGDGKITEDDMTYLGSASPNFTGGFNLNLSYKNFDLVLFFNGSYGNKIVNTMYQSLYSSTMNETNISRDMAVNHWTPLNPNSNVPRLTASDPNSNDTRFSDRWVEDGSYMKLKNLQLGYTLPLSVAKKIKMKNIRVYTSIDNLYTLTKYSGLDPELFGLYGNPFNYGVDMVNYPQPRSLSFGLNLTF